MTQIKICGITREEEAIWLNQAGVDYAGFVFYEKSRRNVTINHAEQIIKKLNANIKKVAVVVSPDARQIDRLGNVGFDILQVHGSLSEEASRHIRLPVWRALNLTNAADMAKLAEDAAVRQGAYGDMEPVQAVLVDAGEYGGGRTFGWETVDADCTGWRETIKKLKDDLKERNVLFVLAGGLNAGNVAEGIHKFSPDVVDVSSGVEADAAVFAGKSRRKLEEFVRAVRSKEQTRTPFAVQK